MALDHRLTADSQYLWTLPMFHCDGWCFPWATAAAGSCNVCIPRIEPERVWQLFREGITHFCAAPTVCTMLMASPAAGRLPRKVRLFTAGAPPSPTLIARMAELNFEIDHVYGLTEVYGPFTIAVPAPGQDRLPSAERAALQARQGFAYLTLFTALISVNLAVLNLLPVPMLDGGHLLFFVCEAVLGRPISVRKREIAPQVGFVLLMMLMVYAVYNDLSRLDLFHRFFR